VFWLSYKKCNLAVFGVNRVVIEPGWLLRREFGLMKYRRVWESLEEFDEMGRVTFGDVHLAVFVLIFRSTLV
jgi:hypothetical protein